MVKVRGSKDGKILTAKFNGKAKSLFPALKQTKSLVLLSIVGNEFCSDRYLNAIINKAHETHEFITFLIADEVYWHNLRNDFSDTESIDLKKQALELGSAYLEKHIEYFLIPLGINYDEFNRTHNKKTTAEKVAIINEYAKKSSNFEILGWNDWLDKCPAYNGKKEAIISLYKTDNALKKGVTQTADNFAKRHQNGGVAIELLHRKASAYLIEETSAIIWIAATLGYNFIIYPGDIIKTFKESKEYFVKDQDYIDATELHILADNRNLLVNWLDVSFQRSHEHKLDSTAKKTLSVSSSQELSCIIQGITQGVFALDLEQDRQIKLLVEILHQYKDM